MPIKVWFKNSFDTSNAFMLASFKGVLIAPHGARLLADDASCIVLHFKYLL